MVCHPSPPADVSVVAATENPTLQRQNEVLMLFPEGSLIPSLVSSMDAGFGAVAWETWYQSLLKLHELMQRWSAPLPLSCEGPMGKEGTESELHIEKELARHYAQTFFDTFGCPPILLHCSPLNLL